NTSFPSTLAIVQGLLAVLGMLVLILQFRTRRGLPWFALLLSALGIIILMLSVSQPVWDTLSILSFLQLPMRLRGLGALCLAPLVGLVILAIPPKWQLAATVFVVLALVLSAIPILYPRYYRDVPANPILSDMFAYEQRTGALGTTSFGEYLPTAVENPP